MLNLFVSPKEIARLRADLQKRQDRKTSALPSSSPSTAPAPPADPAPAAPPASPPQPAAPAPEPAPAEPAEKKPWTTDDDISLLRLKGEGKTWAEIAAAIPGHDVNALESRHKEISLPAAAAEGGDTLAAPTAEPAKTTNGKGVKGQKGKQKGEGGGKKDGKGKAAQAKGGDKPIETTVVDETAEPFTDAAGAAAAEPVKKDEAVVASAADRKVKGILKRGVEGGYQEESMVIPAGATSVNGRPIIYIEENDPLDVNELSVLYHMHMAFEEQRWIRMASKFFDQTGKRIEPNWLKEKLQNCRL
ncbi:MAG: hypothetical protein Q9166_002551 [cf. Caloplaca sp. 2 TL-2023]